MSSPSNSGSVDLESVLHVHRRHLASIGEGSPLHNPHSFYQNQVHHHRYTDTVHLVREEKSFDLEKFDSKIFLFGELQFLCTIFERYTSNIIVYEESIGSNSHRTSFSITFEEDEKIEENNDEQQNVESIPIVSQLRQTSISSESCSPPATSHVSSSIQRRPIGSIGRSHTITSSASDYSHPNLEGKRYGSIQLPSMSIIEIFEILFRTNLDLVHVSNEYDQNQILHQNFLFSKSHSMPLRFLQQFSMRT